MLGKIRFFAATLLVLLPLGHSAPPAFVTKEGSILGVLYGANPLDLLNAANQIYARWLQKKVVITDCE